MTTPVPLLFRLVLQLLPFQLPPIQIELDLPPQGEPPLDLLSPKKLRDGQVNRFYPESWPP